MIVLEMVLTMTMEIIELLVMMEMSKLLCIMILMELSVIMKTIMVKGTTVGNVVLMGQIRLKT